jgi:hypothetical protein
MTSPGCRDEAAARLGGMVAEGRGQRAEYSGRGAWLQFGAMVGGGPLSLA